MTSRSSAPATDPTVADGHAKLREYGEHRLERERALVGALDEGLRGSGELLDAAWSDVPQALRPAAAVTLAAHLDKLAEEDRLPDGVERPDVEGLRRARCRLEHAPNRRTRTARRGGGAAPRGQSGELRRPQDADFDSPFPPIADLGFLSDCHTGALVASDGSIEWMCLPHFDSPSVFGSLLDRGAGSWRVGPYGVYVPAGRRYLPGHEHDRDDLDDRPGVGAGHRRVDDRDLARQQARAPATRGRPPTTTPTTCWCD